MNMSAHEWAALRAAMTALAEAWESASTDPADESRALATLERRVSDVQRLLASRTLATVANSNEQLANHEQRLRGIEQSDGAQNDRLDVFGARLDELEVRLLRID